jgi:class 3 adenylate cyclase/tetratricopeptide (TPR) repeat protein
VTVLFADMKGSLEVIAARDPEDARTVLDPVLERMMEAVHRYEGTVNQVMGDGILALFGAPIAHEDDPVRAARAALDLRGALSEANAEIAELLAPWEQLLQLDRQFLKQRIGINTGVMFAGQVGSAARHEYTVMGQHVNLSARLMSAAEEDTVVLSPSTRRAAERHIALRELPPVRLKGIAEPVPIAEALHPFEVAQGARQSMHRPELVGRAAELEQLIAITRDALATSGRVVALVGEAGTGKSRLIEDLLQRLVRLSGQRELPSFFPFSAECQSYDQSTPYAVVRELMRQILNLGLARGLADETAILERRVRELSPELARFTPLLGDVLGVPIGDTALTAALTPQQRHDRGQDLIEALLLAEAQRQPLMLILDDLHWADASSIDLIARLARVAPRGRLLMLLGYRLDPPIAEPWSTLEHCTRLQLRELAPEDSTALVRELLRGDPPAELAALVEKAQGNPFFIEEVVRGMVDSGVLALEDDAWRLTRELDEAAVPGSIEGVITARLDRLEERSREILQVASVIGRRFPYPVLSGIVPARANLVERLRWLSDADLILSDELERELAYLFKHALTRDVAYESILYARRRELHRRVARQIEQVHVDRLDEQLALLARHYLLAEEWPPAFDYHLRAGRLAQARYAKREAIALYERALQIAQRLGVESQGSGVGDQPSDPRPPSPDPYMVELNEQLGAVYALIGEYDTALTRYRTALDLLRTLPDAPPDDRVRLHREIARVYQKRAEFETAFEWVERAMALAGEAQSLELVRCLHFGSGLHLRQGRASQALEWGQRALHLAEQLGSPSDQAEAYMHSGNAYSTFGDNIHAYELYRQSLQLYEQVQDLDRLADAHNNMATTCYDLGKLVEARSHYEAGAKIKEAIGDIYGQALIANNLGNLLLLQGQLDDAIVQFSHGFDIFERLGSPYGMGVLQMNLGSTYLLRGEIATAERHLQRSADLFDQVGAEEFLPELDRYLAELHLRRGDLAKARLACELSLVNATRLEARTEEGASRRTLGQILAHGGDYAGAWEAMQHSLTILREATSPHQIARTLVALAEIAPELGRAAEGQAALAEALPILRDIGAQRDLDDALAVAARVGYST